jgi:hypothetical protein
LKSALILGGYGGFGARLSRRLAQDGWAVTVAGRNADNAAAFAATLPNARGIAADRQGDIAALLSEQRPDLLIDAAGPFQHSDYRVPAACITAGIDYLDLADARGFVVGIGELDAAARASGVCVISGASSVPALSGAALRELCASFETVDAVNIAISASNRATAGASVADAMLSYAGQPLKLWRERKWQTAHGWQSKRKVSFEIEGRPLLKRLVALADIPDHDIVPARLPGRPATAFYAGPELPFQLHTLALLGWCVRLDWMASVRPLARWLLPLQRLTGWMGSDRSAMLVEAKGRGAKGAQTTRWTLIADKGDGPEIPVLATQLLARRLAGKTIAPGAQDAGALLSLPDFKPLFEELAIRHELRSVPYSPLYRRVMGAAYDALPPPVRDMHDIISDGGAAGIATVRRGTSWPARLIASVMGFPPAGEHQLHVGFTEEGGVERWTRNFGGHVFASELSQKADLLTERFGPLRFQFALPSDGNGLRMEMRKWSAFGISLPLALAPKSLAREWAEGEDFCFDVPIALPLVGAVVHYSGRLWRV